MANLADWKEFGEKKDFKDIPVESFAGKDQWADKFMKARHKDLKINQLRNFFGEIQSIQKNPKIWEKGQDKELKEAVSLLQMNLAYDFGRNVITRDFYDIITVSLAKVKVEEDFKKFVVFIKSLIAYHKFHSSDK
jgi:CRISPR-associated protein Csm2